MARRPSGGTRFRRPWSDPGVTKCQHQRAPKRSTARARACAAISSRFLGDVVVVSESINRLAIFATSSIARLNAASFAFDGALKPLSFRTNCSEAARISSSLAGGSKLNSVRIFRHMWMSRPRRDPEGSRYRWPARPALSCELPVFDPMRLVRFGAQPALAIRFVVLVVAFEPHDRAVALER